MNLFKMRSFFFTKVMTFFTANKTNNTIIIALIYQKKKRK